MPKRRLRLSKYPPQTESSRLAPRARIKRNNLSETKRAARFDNEMVMMLAAEQIFLMYDAAEIKAA